MRQEELRSRVEALGRGCLANVELRRALKDGSFTSADFHRELLRVVFRMLVASIAQTRGQFPDLDQLGGLFDHDRTPHLRNCRLADVDMTSIDLGVDELGTAYESLLALRPELDCDSGRFDLVCADGNERKTTGCFYTPPALIERVLESTLDPVLDEAANANDHAAAILGLRICDPSCGTGHFLIAAARRMAKRLGSGSLRDVIDRCIFGVDINPLALELCQATLGLELREPGRPLSFLEHIQCGNALVGNPPVMARGGFDVVIGNPPWVSYSGRQRVDLDPEERRRLLERHPEIAKWPSAHGAFLTTSIGLARPGGRVGLVLPLQVAEQDAYSEVRRKTWDLGFAPDSITDVGENAFPGVNQAVGLFAFTTRGDGQPPKRWSIDRAPATCGSGDPLREQLIVLERFPRFPTRTFSDPGVHTGNVSKKVILNEPIELPAGSLVPVREGKDIEAYHCGPARKWLWLDAAMEPGEYYRVRDVEVYLRAPILVRQTANRPVAALHADPTHFRNSLLACRGVEGIPHAAIAACLNSNLFAALHRAATQDANQKAFPQVKVGHLQSLPMVVPCDSNSACLAELARLASNRPPDVRRIESLVLELFELPPSLLPGLLEPVRESCRHSPPPSDRCRDAGFSSAAPLPSAR